MTRHMNLCICIRLASSSDKRLLCLSKFTLVIKCYMHSVRSIKLFKWLVLYDLQCGVSSAPGEGRSAPDFWIAAIVTPCSSICTGFAGRSGKIMFCLVSWGALPDLPALLFKRTLRVEYCHTSSFHLQRPWHQLHRHFRMYLTVTCSMLDLFLMLATEDVLKSIAGWPDGYAQPRQTSNDYTPTTLYYF
jgi:hypothetical protein